MAQNYDVYYARMILTLGLMEREKVQRALGTYQRTGGQGGFPRHLVDQKLLDAKSADKVAAELEKWFRAQQEGGGAAAPGPPPSQPVKAVTKSIPRPPATGEAPPSVVRRSSGDQRSPLAPTRETPATPAPRESTRLKKTSPEVRAASERLSSEKAPAEKPEREKTSERTERVRKATSERAAVPPEALTPSKAIPRESARLKRASNVGDAVRPEPIESRESAPPPRDGAAKDQPRESARLKRTSADRPAPDLATSKSRPPSDVGANPSEQELMPVAERGEQRDSKQWALFEKATKDPLAKLVGRRLGRSELTKLVQTGEVVTIFEGHFGDDERGAIVKVLRPERAKDKVGVERFTREGQLLAKIDHPNIARVLEAGVAEGVRFLTMEVGAGEPLSTLLERSGRLPAERAVRLGRGIALGLAAAHRAGIVHRDLRPANVLVEGDGTVKLVGFGIARELAVPGRLTATGQITGHPAYVAPEIAMGDEITGKADVYSLGVVLYLALAGRLPFESRSLVKLVAMHLNTPPPPLLQASPGCPPKLAALVQIKLLAKDPALRPDPQEVANALAAKDLLEGAKEPAAPGGEKKPDTEEELRRAMATDEHPAVELGGPACAACELPRGPNSASVHGNAVCERCLERVEALDLCAACLQEVPSSSGEGVCVFAGHIYCAACTARVKLPCVVCKRDVPLAGLAAGQAKVKGDQLVHFTCPPR